MPKFKTFLGNVVTNQEMFSEKHCSLFGKSPGPGAILSNYDLDGAVAYDGEAWRELDLAAMQRAIIQRQGHVPEYGSTADQ